MKSGLRRAKPRPVCRSWRSATNRVTDSTLHRAVAANDVGMVPHPNDIWADQQVSPTNFKVGRCCRVAHSIPAVPRWPSAKPEVLRLVGDTAALQMPVLRLADALAEMFLKPWNERNRVETMEANNTPPAGPAAVTVHGRWPSAKTRRWLGFFHRQTTRTFL